MLPACWKPKNASSLVRVGPNEDGGYVLPKVLLENTELLIGLGVAEDWRFEIDFRKHNRCKIVCYDHTVTAKFWRKRFKKDLLKFLLLRRLKPRKIVNMFKYFSYKNFFNGKDVVHHQLMVGYDIPGQISIDRIISEHKQFNNILFKIDIEGSEYRVVKQLNNHVNKILGFIIEFHDIDIHRDWITNFILQSTHFELVHVHANNGAKSVDNNGDPTIVEMSFVRKNLIENHQQEDINYPISGLDYPNVKKYKDIALNFEAR